MKPKIAVAMSAVLNLVGAFLSVQVAKTISGGYVTFYSRTRNELWTKGETSGNRLKVVSASTDCDRDTLLFRVEVEGEGVVCHEGTRSCFTKEISVAGAA